MERREEDEEREVERGESTSQTQGCLQKCAITYHGHSTKM
jgi:hypothetical protein